MKTYEDIQKVRGDYTEFVEVKSWEIVKIAKKPQQWHLGLELLFSYRADGGTKILHQLDASEMCRLAREILRSVDPKTEDLILEELRKQNATKERG